MKKLFLFFAVSMLMMSCNAQQPTIVNEEIKEFVAETNLSADLTQKLDDALTQMHSMAEPMEKLAKEYETADEARKQQIVSEFETAQDEMLAFIKQVIKDNHDNMIPAFFAKDVMYNLDFNELQELCDENAPYYNHVNMKAPKQLFDGLKKRAPGSMFTDLEEADLDGKMHKLSEFVGKGNYVLIDFWASWCGPCCAEMPNVKANYDKYHSKGFEIVGLSFDQNHEAWEKAVKTLDLNWIHLSDLKGWQTEAGAVYGVMSIPASVLVDPEGRIVAEGLRGEALGAKLAEIYGE